MRKIYYTENDVVYEESEWKSYSNMDYEYSPDDYESDFYEDYMDLSIDEDRDECYI